MHKNRGPKAPRMNSFRGEALYLYGNIAKRHSIWSQFRLESPTT